MEVFIRKVLKLSNSQAIAFAEHLLIWLMVSETLGFGFVFLSYDKENPCVQRSCNPNVNKTFSYGIYSDCNWSDTYDPSMSRIYKYNPVTKSIAGDIKVY